jgi:tetratricopeptide (TPR) repeat protein
MIAARHFPTLLLLAISCVTLAHTQATDEAAEREARHRSSDWQIVAPHLPDPATGAPAALETAADVLRARRLPEDALDYYRFALARGGDKARLMNRIGVTELELRRPTAARMAFKLAIAADPKNAEAWNNLGASEYVVSNFNAAISDYRKAVKLNKNGAVYHSNLGTAYFEQKDFEGARTEFATAVRLDPQVFSHGGWGGVEAHVMSPQDRGRFCFEMAKLAALTHNDESMLLWLARSSEAGFDLGYEMAVDKTLAPFRHDERVLLLIRNAKAMRSGQFTATAPAPALLPDPPKH